MENRNLAIKISNILKVNSKIFDSISFLIFIFWTNHMSFPLFISHNYSNLHSARVNNLWFDKTNVQKLPLPSILFFWRNNFFPKRQNNGQFKTYTCELWICIHWMCNYFFEITLKSEYLLWDQYTRGTPCFVTPSDW